MTGTPGAWGQLDLLQRLDVVDALDTYRAYDRVLQREVTLQLYPAGIDAATRDRALERAGRLASVRHPRVIAVHGVEEHEGRLGIWMEQLGGRSLEDWIAGSAPGSANDIVAVGVDLSLALHALHSSGLSHGQLRGASALRDAQGRVVLIDTGRGGPSDRLEQEVDDDLEALGRVLLELALGPKESRGAAAALSERRTDLPASLRSLIALLVDGSAALRPRSAVEVGLWISACIESDLPFELPSTEWAARRSLPHPTTRLIGRARERREIRLSLFEERLVVVTGPGGSGKTRLVAEVAADLLPAYPKDFAWVDLARLAEGAEIGAELLQAAGFPAVASRSDEESLAVAIGESSFLLVLDNCEHVRAACSRVLELLLSRCPRLRVLATSREPLGAPGEVTTPLSPLSLPDRPDLSPDSWLRADAVRLFVERVTASRPDFRPTGESLSEAVRICRLVDGIPLAIELAAARALAFPLAEIANRLERSLSILKGEHDPSARSATMEASIDWSYRLLEPSEQTLLRRVGLLATPWTIEAARALGAEEGGGATEEAGTANTVDLDLESLVQKSLVERTIGFDGTPRYRLLELIRRFARAAAERAESIPDSRRRHFDFYLSRAIHHGSLVFGPEGATHTAWMAELTPNFRIAFETALTPEVDLPRAHQFTWYFSGALERMGRWPELWTMLDRMLSRDTAPVYGRAHLLIQTADCAYALGKSEERLAAADESYAIFQSLGNRDGMATARLVRALADVDNEALESARAHALEALEVRIGLGLENEIAGAELILGVIAARQGDFAESARRYRSALARAVATGYQHLVSRARSNLAAALRDLGELGEARELAVSTLSEVRASDDRQELSNALRGLGSILRRTGEYDDARAHLLEALHLYSSERQPHFAAEALLELSMLAWAEARAVRAARLLGAAEGLFESVGTPIPAWHRDEHGRLTEELRESLGETSFLVERVSGRTMNLDQAIAFARSE